MDVKNDYFLLKTKNKTKTTFKLNTQKITMIGILLAFTTVVSLLEIPTFFESFLKLDFGNTINLMAVLIIGLPYSLLIAMIVPWLKLAAGGELIGDLAYMISTITFLLLYCSLQLLFHQLLFSKIKPTNAWKPFLLVELLTAIITCILQSLLNTFFNWSFILDLYSMGYLKNQIWVVFLPFNCFKFSLVLSLYLVLLRPVKVLLKNINYLPS